MKKIQTHILKIKQWNQTLVKTTVLNNEDIKNINENDNIEEINSDISKTSTLS